MSQSDASAEKLAPEVQQPVLQTLALLKTPYDVVTFDSSATGHRFPPLQKKKTLLRHQGRYRPNFLRYA
jgi:hypothetical protein